MSVSCFLCEASFKIEKNQSNTLNNLLKLNCFSKFDKTTHLYDVCNMCCDNNKSFIKIHDFAGFENHKLSEVNLFISNDNIYISKQNINSVFKQSEKKKKQQERKEELLAITKRLKIEYKKTICDEYIKYGKIKLEDVIKRLTDLQTNKNDRLYDLLNELQNHNIDYDSNLPSFKKYIQKGGNIKKTIEKAKLEQTLAKNTDYLTLLNNCVDSETAIELSVNQFPNNDDENVNKYIEDKTRIIF